MKNDPIFKFVAVIIIAGVLVALIAPNHTTSSTVATAAKPASVQVIDGAQ